VKSGQITSGYFTTSIYVGNYCEVINSLGTTTTNKYFYEGASRIAKRVIVTGGSNTVNFILSDQISSTSFINNAN